MLPTALEMQAAVDVPIACQPKGFEQKVDTEERGYTASRFEKSVAPEGMAVVVRRGRRIFGRWRKHWACGVMSRVL